jgi:hypothetical protein
MFKTDKYKITFERVSVLHNDKRFDTCCRIFNISHPEDFIGCQIACLNPKDKYDKIIGKKIALTKTLKYINMDKVERAEIWQAFWEWVNSWEEQAINDRVKNRQKDFTNDQV